MTQTNQHQTNETLYCSNLYIITAKTNMHVGSGDEAYGLVDNRVQRDVVTQLPNINASGLKGALREYFTDKLGGSSQKVIDIFGTDSALKPDKHEAGKFRFFNANLLTIPVRSNVRPFFRATSPLVIKELLDMMDTFGYQESLGIKEQLQHVAALNPPKGKVFTFTNEGKEAILEDFQYSVEFHDLKNHMLSHIIGEHPVLMNHEDFADMCDDYHLPLIARNCLANGRSTNIWHEQVVPRESRFYFFLLKPRYSDENLEFFAGDPVQIGGNASIGYGFTRIEKIDQLAKPMEKTT